MEYFLIRKLQGSLKSSAVSVVQRLLEPSSVSCKHRCILDDYCIVRYITYGGAKKVDAAENRAVDNGSQLV